MWAWRAITSITSRDIADLCLALAAQRVSSQ
jgi:hypothetical protein